mgnify:CR=1 FL=1
MHHRAVIVVMYLVWNSLVCGCGYSRPARVDAIGRVTLGGKPLDGASVTLVPVNGGRPSFAVTADDGGFSLGTFGATDGVIPGRYRVAVVKQVLRSTADKRLEKSFCRRAKGRRRNCGIGFFRRWGLRESRAGQVRRSANERTGN